MKNITIKHKVLTGLSMLLIAGLLFYWPGEGLTPALAQEQDPTEEPFTPSEPTSEPVAEPTTEPVVEPTEEPTEEPAVEPTEEPTEEPTAEPAEEVLQLESSVTPTLDITWEYTLLIDADFSAAVLSDELSAQGLQAQALPADSGMRQLIISGGQDLAQLRSLLYDSTDLPLSLIGGPAQVTIELSLADTQPFTLKLEGNFSTGYGWEVLQASSGGADMAVNQDYTFRGGMGMPELNSTHFLPAAPGAGLIRLVYGRPFEQQLPITRNLSLILNTPADIDLSDPTPPSMSENMFTTAENPIADLIQLSTLPSAWDWREAGIIPAVRDQGNCGSCWAFGTVGVMEAAITRSNGPLQDLSEQFLLSCNKNGYDCSGGRWAHQYHYNTLAKNQNAIGAVQESDNPYIASVDSCNVAYNHPYRLNNWGLVGGAFSVPTVEELKNAIYQKGPVAVSLCTQNAFNSYSSGIFSTNETCGTSTVNHGVILVGWNDADGGYWILRNSWNTTWGESGYMKIKYGTSMVGYEASWAQYTGPAPGPSSPTGTIFDSTPTYKWIISDDTATQYQFQVYKGTTKVLDKTVSNSVCNGSTCSTTPSTLLASAAHKWRVRAYINGAWTSYSAYKNFSVSPIPTTISPGGLIASTKPSYSWSRIKSATKYQLQVYMGSSKVLDKVVSSSVCGTSTCSNRPDKTLSNANYKWRVRAYLNGAWKSWTAYKNFEVFKGFSSSFNGSYSGWIKNPGASWKIFSGSYYGTNGTINKFSSTRYRSTYKNLDYSARMRRVGGIGYQYPYYYFPYNYLNVRMGTSFESSNGWYPGYYFGYYDYGFVDYGGLVYIFEATSTGSVIVKYKGYSSAIYENYWNTLRVVANGSTFKFYINDSLIHTFSDSTRPSGYVGMTMAKITSATTSFYADWAKLSRVSISAASEQEVDLEQQASDQADFNEHWIVEIDPETLVLKLTPK